MYRQIMYNIVILFQAQCNVLSRICTEKQHKCKGFAICNLKGVERDVKLEATA